MHRDGVVWFLQKRLERAGELQRSMVEIRVQREVERSRSILYKARGNGMAGLIDSVGVTGGDFGGGGQSSNAAASSSMAGIDMDREEYERQQRQAMETMLSPEQVQMFESEQREMLKHYSENLNKIRYSNPLLHQSTLLLTPI
jgi:syntaxin 18